MSGINKYNSNKFFIKSLFSCNLRVPDFYFLWKIIQSKQILLDIIIEHYYYINSKYYTIEILLPKKKKKCIYKIKINSYIFINFYFGFIDDAFNFILFCFTVS